MPHIRYALLATAMAFGSVSLLSAQPPQGAVASTGLPAGPGQAQTQRMCSGCHEIDWVTRHRDTPAGWASMVDSMVARGAQGSEADITLITNYLAKNFPGGAHAAAAVPQPPSAPRPQAAVKPAPAARPASSGRATGGSAARSTVGANWTSIKGDPGSQGYSPLTDINAANVGKLKLAWSYETLKTGEAASAPAAPGSPPGAPPRARISQIAPLIVDGVMYVTTPFGRAVALDADSGKEIWSHALLPQQGTPGVRSLAYWPGDGTAGPAIYFGTTGGLVMALDVRTGKPMAGFGVDGAIKFTEGMLPASTPNARLNLSSPPVFYKNIMITGGQNQENPALGASGDIRGWDARTGKLLWRFHTIPQPGEPGHETWSGDSWKDRSGGNAWGLLTVDVEDGTVYVPLGTVSADYFGGDRPGDNLYGVSLVALDANTGQKRWHYQVVHHDVWDRDLNAAPTLINVKHGNDVIPAVAQVTKHSLLFILDRKTGKPVYPVEERPVEQTGFYPGEKPAATQPIPVRPGPLARAHYTPGEIVDITPEHTAYCKAMEANGRAEPRAPAGQGGLRGGGLFASFGAQGTIVFPGTLGGMNYEGMSYDPKLGYLVSSAMNLGEIFQQLPPEPDAGPDAPPRNLRYHFWDPVKMWPCQTGPWGELVAVNVNTGEIAWRRPMGEYPALAAMGIKDQGTPVMGGTMSTAGGVTFAGGTLDNKFRAFSTESGKELWSVDVGAAAHNLPVTYRGKSGRQYVAIVVAGGGFLRDPVIPAVVKVYALP
jgi:quinoprotein glucose dehydrogenase